MSLQDYTGIDSLENLKEAVNYNDFLEKQLLDFIGHSGKILDFGSGNGEFAMRLLRKSKRADCVEVDPKFSELLRQNGFNVFNSIEDLPDGYEKIYSLNVLEHIEDDAGALKKLYSKLNSGGKIFIYVPAFMLLYSDFDKKIGHFRRYTKSELSGKLEAAGFIIDRAEYVDFGGFFAWWLLKLLGKNNSEPNRKMIKIYDRRFFPISRIGDLVFKYFLGKNLLFIAHKA